MGQKCKRGFLISLNFYGQLVCIPVDKSIKFDMLEYFHKIKHEHRVLWVASH